MWRVQRVCRAASASTSSRLVLRCRHPQRATFNFTPATTTCTRPALQDTTCRSFTQSARLRTGPTVTVSSVGEGGSSTLLNDHSSADDIEEPDVTRQDAAHAHEPIVADDVPLQGLTTAETSVPPFTASELAALIHDLRAFQEAVAAAPTTTDTATNTAPPPTSPEPKAPTTTTTPQSDSTPSSAAGSSSGPERPFLASWSVKEVASWYLQVEEQLHLPTPPHTPPSVDADATATAATTPMSFVDLLQKHAIDGARLLSFTSDPQLIPLLSPALLSRILYLRGLDTYSHMFQPTAGMDDHASSADPNMRHLQDILHSTVKIYCTSTAPDFARPWAQMDQVDSTSSGFVIAGRRIIGNAHGATSATNIRVRKHGDATKYKATVSVISHEADLVILEVNSEKFWRDLEPLQFGHVPRLQDTVIVVGYPTGGDSICVTKGVVSRILVSNYVHSDESLLTCQIDAAINSGNSGGPVLLNGAVVGVAFQGVSHAQSVGYIIPIPVVLHFLTDLQLHGRYTGFPSFGGLTLQKLENESLKKYFGLGEDETGVIVMSVAELDHAHAALRKNDVITHVDGISVADDGSIFFRHGERISMRYLPSSKFVGDTIKLRVVRDRKPIEVSFALQARRSLVPTHLYDSRPSYFILGGLVFTPLTRPYLVDTFGKSWIKRAPVDLIQRAYYGLLSHPDQQVVILSTILVHDVNTGYGASFHNVELCAVNGHKVNNLKHLLEIVENERRIGSPFLRFDFTLNRVILLETELAFASTEAILDECAIEFDRSADLREEGEETNRSEEEEAQDAELEEGAAADEQRTEANENDELPPTTRVAEAQL